MAYEYFYRYYDALMADIPYEDYLSIIKQHLPKEGSALDLGCGTGNILIPLVKEGYHVDGLDQNELMLSIASQKLSDANLRASLFCDGMQHLKQKETYDMIFSLIDTLNYLSEYREVVQTFQGVYAALKPGGVFFFDVHNMNSLRETFEGYSYHEDHPSFTYLWDTYLEEAEDNIKLYHELSFFIEETPGFYKRLDESHLQVVFPSATYLNTLKQVGFRDIIMLADFKKEKDPNAAKYQFICVK